MNQLKSDRFRMRLGQTRAWLGHEKPLVVEDDRVRRISRLQLDEALAADEPRTALAKVAAERERLLVEAGVAWQQADSQSTGGRILFLLTDRNLMDGSAQAPSGGFVGELNVPVCDCWVDFFENVQLSGGAEGPALACWVPGELVDFAQRAIDVNPEECLVWADEG